MPKSYNCRKCGKSISEDEAGYAKGLYKMWENLCDECGDKVGEAVDGAAERYESSLRSDGISGAELDRRVRGYRSHIQSSS